MKNHYKFTVFISALLFLTSSSADAAWKYEDRRLVKTDGAWAVQNGTLVKVDENAVLPGPEHYRLGAEAFNNRNWEEAVKQFRIVSLNFPQSTYGQDAIYYLGISNYYLQEYDLANDDLNRYLQSQTNPKYFQEAVEYKFAVAEQFRKGAKRRLWGTKQLPKWASGTDLASEIYDEVVIAMPSHDIAAQALYCKACLLSEQKKYRESIEALQNVIRRFPKNELAPESFLMINKIYLEQCQKEFQNPDIIAFAQINLKNFEEMFPGEERLQAAKEDMLRLKEVYAQGLFETAQFYEKVRQPKAAVIYYQKAAVDYPETTIAQRCRQRLSRLFPVALEYQLPKTPEDAADTDIPSGIQFSAVDDQEAST